jgi:glycosyltransferase involved in cell wall biosynthesis
MWASSGWRAAVHDFVSQYPQKRQKWFLLQYTALAWSRRGFSWRFLSLLRELKKQGARCAVVFHDAETYFGNRLIDRTRRTVQLYTMRKAVLLSDLSIFTIPQEKIPWLAPQGNKATFIPVGANLPEPESAWQNHRKEPADSPSVAVFSLSSGSAGAGEVKAIAGAALFVIQKIGNLRIVLVGRNSEVAQVQLSESLHGTQVQIDAFGLLPAKEVAQTLSSCEAMLFVRGPLSTRRGSAMAGIACGLPVIAREGWETAPPVTSAGVVLVPPSEDTFGPALLRVLTDNAFRISLAERSRQAYEQFFSWQAIAAQFVAALQENSADK